jgi:hypothetical protein
VVEKREKIINRQLRTRFVMAGGRRGMTLKGYNENGKLRKGENAKM